MRRRVQVLVPLVSAAMFACADSLQGPGDPMIATANPVLGRQAFEQACSSCHASGDGFDLKAFSFTDTTIIRRAVKHVDSATARDIVAYIRGLEAPPHDESARLFQPRGAPLSGDVEFANALFGRDAWPAELTTADLIAIDPRTVQVAIRLPVWSDEQSNRDWMPDFELPAGVLDHSGGMARGAIAGYNAAPTADNLVRAVSALRNADRATMNAAAPCLLDDSVRVRYRECFEVRRWTSTLVALHILRNRGAVPLTARIHDVWWDVGNAARRSRGDRSVPIANATENWATWMFLGWSFDPSRHASVYTGGGFRQLGLTRHATFVALRSQVARPRNSLSIYDDLVNAVRFAPASWTLSVTTFAFRHLGERLEAGDRPPTDQIEMAKAAINTALTESFRKVAAVDRAKIDAAALPVLAALQR